MMVMVVMMFVLVLVLVLVMMIVSHSTGKVSANSLFCPSPFVGILQDQSVMRTRPPKGGRAAKAASGVTRPA
jgi:hypothetical protein